MDVGAQIARYLRKKGTTQQQLADRAGLHASQVSELLTSEGNPTLRTIARIEEALGDDVIVVPDFYKEELYNEGYIPTLARGWTIGNVFTAKCYATYAYTVEEKKLATGELHNDEQSVDAEPESSYEIPA